MTAGKGIRRAFLRGKPDIRLVLLPDMGQEAEGAVRHAVVVLLFDQRQGLTNVRFEGLDGTESVTSLKQALSL